MKRKIKEIVNLAFLMAFLLASCMQAMAADLQNGRKIKGVVVSATDGQPLIGATVLVKGTKDGAITDVDGKFSISAGENAVLQITYVGFISQDVSVGNQSSLKISLKESSKTIEEVVVVGYGTQKKKLVTGATVQLKSDDLEKRSTMNALQAMQGKAAGVNITSTSGQPGGGMKVNVRGVGTIGNASPTYVVDGVITGDITYLNNADIASIDVLKDAASCAIYGVNGANGVILITTKGGTGTAKGGQISFDGYYGIQNASRKVNLLNTQEYATIVNEAAINSGKLPYFNQSQMKALTTNTNWLNSMLAKDVPTQNYSISANGGNATGNYSLGMSYTQQGGIVGGTNLSNYERYNFRSNAEHKMYGDFLKVGEHLTFSHSNQKGIKDGDQYNNSIRSALSTSPLLAMYDANGNFLNSENYNVSYYDNDGQQNVNKSWNNTESNPYAMMKYTNQNNTKTQKLIGDVYAEIQPIKDLKIKSSFGLDYYSSAYHAYLPTYRLSIYAINDREKISQNASSGYTWNWDNTANYLFKINDHSFDVMAGSSIRKSQGTWLNGSNQGTTYYGDFKHSYLSLSQNTTDGTLMSLTGNENAIVSHTSFFGRVNYNYKERYMATAVFRRDGSTMFQEGYQWGNFPSLSAGWVVSNESFMQSTSNWMDFLKIRASWGTNGNDKIKEFQYLSLIALTNAEYNFSNDQVSLVSGAYPATQGTKGLKWETSYQTDLGFDARFLNGKLNLNFDYYNKTTKDWLVRAPLLATVGVSENPFINGGDVTNKGIELQLAYNDKIGKDFSYSISGSYAYNKNEVNDIPTQDGIIHGGTNILFDNAPEFFRASEGQPLGYFWGYKTAGIFQNEAEVAAYKSNGKVLQPSAKPGDVKYVDLSGDGVIDESDRTNIGDPNPHHIFGLNISTNYKNLDFSITASGVAGNKLVQSYRNMGNQFGNWTTAILDRWHGEGTSNTTPRVTLDNNNWTKFSDLYVQKGDYLRISNVTLGYDLSKLFKSRNISQLRVYFSAENLFTFTKYNGMDPEVGFSAQGANSDYNFGQGVDIGYYPRPRTYLVGVSAKF